MITDKIDKLIKLSENNDNENEKQNAMNKAKNLIVDNGLHSIYREFLRECYRYEERGLVVYQEHAIEEYELNPSKEVELPEIEIFNPPKPKKPSRVKKAFKGIANTINDEWQSHKLKKQIQSERELQVFERELERDLKPREVNDKPFLEEIDISLEEMNISIKRWY